MAFHPPRLSRYLSYVLRHRPDSIGLNLDGKGWALVEALIARSDAAGAQFDLSALLHAVETDDKQRFVLSADGRHIRAAQGHSVAIDLGLPPRRPPEVLYHGTATRFLPSIAGQGLRPQSRRHVHLSVHEQVARQVGRRHGEPVVLQVRAGALHQQGVEFFRSDNGVWLVSQVPVQSLVLPSSHRESA